MTTRGIGCAATGIAVIALLALSGCGPTTAQSKAATDDVAACAQALEGVTDAAARLHSDGAPDLVVVDLYVAVDDTTAAVPDDAVNASLECGWSAAGIDPNAVSLRVYAGPLPTELALDRPFDEVDLTDVPVRLGLHGASAFDRGLIVPRAALSSFYGPRK